MAVVKILTVKDQVLRQKAKSILNVDKRIQKVFKDLEGTLRAQKDPVGVGLAAPQIGKQLALFVVKYGGKVLPFINAKVIWRSEETNDPPSSYTSRRTRLGPAVRRRKQNIPSPDENLGGREYILEGCLSLPHYYGPVRRANSIKVKYQTPKLETMTKSFTGLPAQIIQHEVDHLNGILFIDHLLAQKRKLFKLEKGEWVEVELP